MGLTDAEQQALLWPIQAKGAVNRVQPLGDPSIEQFYHNSMEQGRFLESSIADANNWLLQKKILLNEYVISYTHMNGLAVDGQLGHTARVPKYIADSISILQTAQRLQQELVSLVNAVQGNITKLLAIEQSMTNMVRVASQSLANLLNNVCNWGIPGLPSIPNLFPDQIWNWNGYLFSPLALFAALKSNTHFNFDFTFSQCSFGPTSTSDLFVTNPLSTQTYSGLVYGSANYQPPQGGVATPAAQDLTDPVFIAQMQGTTANPVFNPAFNPNENMLGAVADPHTIIDNYQMPAATYVADIVSICPQLRSNTVEPTDPDYANPNLQVRTPQLSKDLAHFVNLANIVASNFDPFVVSAWLLYLNTTRTGRGGAWLPNFEAVYQQYIQPSIGDLLTLSVPWNDLIGQTNYLWMGTWSATTAYVVSDIVTLNGINYVASLDNTGAEPDINPTLWVVPPVDVIYSNTPVIQLVTTFQSLSSNQLNHLLWQLSYIEASLLGYTRNGTWDATQDAVYLSGATGFDLDYKPTLITAQTSNLVLGAGTAEFPVPVTFPSTMSTTMNQVVALASTNIQNDVKYLSPRLGNRFTYDQFAQATMVDRFSQFWRDFATNLSHFLAQDPYLVQFAISYSGILDGALDPLTDPTNAAAYSSLLSDVATRNRAWLPGTPLLPIPVAPIVNFQNNSIPDVNTNGWNGDADFNPVTFLVRPDIQALPIPVQTAMLRTNLSYAGLQVWQNAMQSSITGNIANANALLTAAQQIGFEVNVVPNAITQTSITSNVLTVVAPNAYQAGDTVLLEGTIETFLNGELVTVLGSPAPSATQFSASGITHADYTNLSDTGTAGLETNVPVGTSVPIQFATIDFDFTGNVTNRTTFTIQTAGQYSGVGSTNFVMPVAGTATVTVTQNSIAVATASVTGSGAVIVPISFTGTFATDDIVQVLASTNLVSNTAQVVSSSIFTMTLNQVTATPSGNQQNQDVAREYGIDVPFYLTAPIPFLTAVQINQDGNVLPLDPTVPSVTNVAITTNVLTITANHHFNVGDLVTFSGIGTATFLNGTTATITTRIGSSPNFTGFTASFTHANYSSTADTGSVLRAINTSGAVIAPNPDGITLNAGTVATITATSVLANVLTVTASNSFNIDDDVLLSGTAETFLNGQSVTISSLIGSGPTFTGFTADFTNADYSNLADSGTVATEVTVTAYYGGQYFVANAPAFTPGALLYVAPGGVLTDDYTTLVTRVGWIICIGRVVSYDAATATVTFIYEPHIPTRFSSAI